MRTLILTLALLLAFTGCKDKEESKQNEAAPAAKAGEAGKTQMDESSILYAMGAMHGENLARFEFTDKQMEDFLSGFKDALGGKKLRLKPADFQTQIREFYTKQMKEIGERNKKRGAEYLEKFLKEEGVKKTASGIGYKILQEGTGRNPTENDTVEVHYKGTLIDGTQFDSSYERNEKITFPLNRVITGWKEGVQLVKEGGKIQLVIPAELAYGDFGAPPKIPGGATLVFEIELFKVVEQKAPEKAPAPAVAPEAKKPVKK